MLIVEPMELYRVKFAVLISLTAREIAAGKRMNGEMQDVFKNVLAILLYFYSNMHNPTNITWGEFAN